MSFTYGQLQACCSISIAITAGPQVACTGSTANYTIDPDNADLVNVTVTNGTLVTVAGIPAGGTSFDFGVVGARLSAPFTATVTWGTGTAARTLTATAIRPNCDDTETWNITQPNSVSILSGPDGVICSSTTSANFSASGGGFGVNRLWSGTSSGSPISFSSTTSSFTTVSGFTPNNLYSINHSIRCGSTTVATASRTVITGIPTPCTPPAAPGEGEDPINTIKADYQEAELHEIHYVQNENGMIKIDSPEDMAIGEQMLSEVKVFPNPITQNANLTINLPFIEDRYQVEFMDMQGRVLKTFVTNDHRFEMSTSNYPTGIYNIRITANGFSSSKRVVIN